MDPHLLILGQTELPEERTFYLQASIAANWSSRELERQLRTQAFRRRDRGSTKVSAALAQIHPAAIDEFKNAYSLEFLDLGDGYSEADLHGALLRDLGRFITDRLRRRAAAADRCADLDADRRAILPTCPGFMPTGSAPAADGNYGEPGA